MQTFLSEIYIEGDGIWAVFNTLTKNDVNSVFDTAAKAASLVDIINVKLKKKGYLPINVGIGIDDGDSLYIKAGHKGSGINEVVWIGRIVGAAAHLCSNGNREWGDGEMMVSERVHNCLTDHNKSLLSWNTNRLCYHGNVINIGMNQWVSNNEN